MRVGAVNGCGVVAARLTSTGMYKRLRFAGTMELSGINRRLDRRRVQAIRKAVHRNVDIPEAMSGGTEWVGMRPMVPDTLPVMGRVPGRAAGPEMRNPKTPGAFCLTSWATLNYPQDLGWLVQAVSGGRLGWHPAATPLLPVSSGWRLPLPRPGPL